MGCTCVVKSSKKYPVRDKNSRTLQLCTELIEMSRLKTADLSVGGREVSMTYRGICVLSIVLLVTAIGLSAQEPASQMNVTSSLLPLEAIVKDSSGRPVLNLKQEDFEIYEDGQLQATRFFALADAPRSTMLIFDRSASAEQQEPFMLQAINSFARTMRPTDRVGIFSFAS